MSEPIPIKLTPRYPESRTEDISDAFMRGVEHGMEMKERDLGIVRCRDCESFKVNWLSDNLAIRRCCGPLGTVACMRGDDFCSKGKRRRP